MVWSYKQNVVGAASQANFICQGEREEASWTTTDKGKMA